jgi:xanthine dehydrogenase accessory factor
MRPDLLRLAAALADRGELFAIATVVARQAPSSAQAGDVALVTKDGAFHGFVGGSCSRPTVLKQCLEAIADGRPRLIVLAPDPRSVSRPGAAVFPMTCHSGGTVEIHIEPVLPPARLLVYGLTPAGTALVRLGAAMGYRVTAVDPAATSGELPEAEAVLTDPAAVPVTPGAPAVFVVVATHGEWDEEAVLASLRHAPSYIGVVASARRAEELRGFLEGKLVGDERRVLQALHAPAGLRIGARSGEEIALSILAEIVEQRAKAQRRPRVELPTLAAEQALDPVCGMTVAVATTRHTAEHNARTYYFCCAGCREKFLVEADRFVTASEGRR